MPLGLRHTACLPAWAAPVSCLAAPNRELTLQGAAPLRQHQPRACPCCDATVLCHARVDRLLLEHGASVPPLSLPLCICDVQAGVPVQPQALPAPSGAPAEAGRSRVGQPAAGTGGSCGLADWHAVAAARDDTVAQPLDLRSFLKGAGPCGMEALAGAVQQQQQAADDAAAAQQAATQQPTAAKRKFSWVLSQPWCCDRRSSLTLQVHCSLLVTAFDSPTEALLKHTF